MRIFTLSLIVTIVFLFSCKKDILKDDKEIFIGNWIWIYSDADIDICEDFPQYDVVLNPDNQNHNYEIEFLKKGKVHFYKDGELINHHRVVFNAFGPPYSCSDTGRTFFAINLDNDPGTSAVKGLEGCIGKDTLSVGIGFPFYDDGCNFYTNYFVKE